MTTHISSELSSKIIDIYHRMLEMTPSIYEIETKTYRPTVRRSFNVTETIWSGVIEELNYE